MDKIIFIIMHGKKLPKRIESIQNKKIILITLMVSIVFGVLFLYINEKTKFSFKESLFLDKENNISNILTNYKKNKNFENVSILEKEKRESKYRELKSKITAKSYFILDVNNKKVLISEKENEKLPLASVTKLMTAYTALSYCNDNLKLELDKILIASDNESADYVASNCPNYQEFVDNMNYLAKKNNLNMTFINPSGLDINKETEASNYGTAVSVANLINLLYEKNPNILNHTTKNSYAGIQNTNEKVTSTPFLTGSKTGYTDMAGGNLVTIYEVGPESRFVIVVLGSTKEKRFTDTELLLNYLLENQ
jgi:D-alanyl-D-alanine carboxypeptidase